MTKVKNSAIFSEINVFKRHSTTTLYEVFLPTALQIDRYVTLTLFVLGVICNTVAIIVWWYPRLRMKESVVLTFVLIAILDLFYLLLALIDDFEKVWSVNVFINDGSCKLFKVLKNSCEFYSIFMILTLCIQHVVSLKNPGVYEYYKSKKWTYLIAFLLGAVSLLFSIAEGVFSSMNNENKLINECTLPKDILLTSKSYQIYYWLVKFFLTSTFVVLISGVCIYILHRTGYEKEKSFHNENCSLTENGYCNCSSLKQSNENKDKLSLTKSVTVIGFYMVFISIPQLILISLEPLNNYGDVRMSDFEVLDDAVWERYFNIEGAKIFFRELYLTLFSIKVLIYFCCTKRFRQCFLEIFGLKIIIGSYFKKRTLPNQEPYKKPKSKPISYYIDRSKNSYPFSNERILEKTVKTENQNNYPRVHRINPSTNINASSCRRAPKTHTFDRQLTKHNCNKIIEPIYYSVPRSSISNHHSHCCKKYYVNNTDKVKKNSKTQQEKKQFHNVYSEFEYHSSSTSTSPNESPTVFVNNCNCYESSDSETSVDKVVLKYKKFGNRLHQV